MATKPVTYFAQNKAIDDIVSQYGPTLNKLADGEKLGMLAVLSRVLFVGSTDDSYSVEEELTDWAYEDMSAQVCESLTALEGSTEEEILGFCMALIDQLK